MKDGKGLNEEQWMVVKYAEAMTRDLVVSDEVFDGVRRFLDDRQVVELTATAAVINCASSLMLGSLRGSDNPRQQNHRR